MKFFKLVVATGILLLIGTSLKAQVKIGDNPLQISTDRWLEIQREGISEFLIVTDSLYFGRSSNPTTSTMDPLMLKLFGYGQGSFSFSAGDQYNDGTNFFLAPSTNGEVLEVPLSLSLVVADSMTADLAVTNGVDTFGTVDLFALDSIFATDGQVRDSISTIRTLVNLSNDADNDTITGNEYIDQINVLGDTALEFVENIAGDLGSTNRDTVDLSSVIGANTFYLADGTLDEDRTVTGDDNSLYFNGVDTFAVSADTFDIDAGFVNIDGEEFAIQQGGQDIIMINSSEDVKIRSTALDSILYLNGTNGQLSISEYGSGNFDTSDFASILVVDASGNIRETSADDILANQVDSTIYNNDGVLTESRNLDGDTNDLSFTNIGSLVDSSSTSLSTTTGSNTVESTGGDVVVDANGTVDIEGSDIINNASDSIVVEGATAVIGGTTTVDINGGSVTVDGSTIDLTTTTGDITIDGTTSNDVSITSDSTSVTGDIQFTTYGDTSHMGTFTTFLAVDVDGNVIEVTADEILSEQVDSTIYNNDGVLTGDRILDGTDSYSLMFDSLTTFDVISDSTLISGDMQLRSYGDTSHMGTFTTFLAVDVDGNVIEVTADEILSEQVDSTIYNNDGVLTESRNLDGDTNDLSFTNIGSLVDSSSTSLSTTTGSNTVESTGGDVVVEANGTVDIDGSDIVNSATDSIVVEGATAVIGGTTTVDINGGSVTVDGSTIDLTTTTGDITIDGTTSNDVSITSDSTSVTGDLQFTTYGDTSHMGTFTTFLAVDVDGNVIEVTADEILSEQVDSTIYNNDGVLSGDRILDGTDSYSLMFDSLTTFDVISDSTLISGDMQLRSYGDTSHMGTFTTFLAVDVDGNVIEVTADEILSEQVDSTIYNNDGVLTESRNLDGDTNDLSFTNIGSLVDSSSTSLSTTTGSNTVESTGGDVVVEANGTVDIDGSDIVNSATDSIVVEGATAVIGGTTTVDINGGSVTVDGSTIDLTTTTGDITIDGTTSNDVSITSDSTSVTGDLQFTTYGDTSHMGTFTTFLAVDVDGNVIEVTADEILSEQVDSTIYNNDGVLSGDRILDGTDSYSLMFDSLTTFDVISDSTLISGDMQLRSYGDTSHMGTFTTFLAVDVDGNVIEVTADEILSEQVDSTIYNNDGVLSGDRILDGTDSYSLMFDSLTTFDVISDSTLISGDMQLRSYGDTSHMGTFTTFLAVDVDGNVIEVTADEILSEQEDSTIYTHDGTLTGMRTMDMNNFNLYFVSSDDTDTTVITNDGKMAIGKGTVTTATMGGREIKLDVNGDILAMQIHSSSDRRFKKNISTVSSALEKVQSLRGVNYEFRIDEFENRDFPKERQLGFIAQEVEKVIPEVVKTAGDGYKSVDYSKVTALLNEAIKEQQDQIEALKTELSKANQENQIFKDELADIKNMLNRLTSKTELEIAED